MRIKIRGASLAGLVSLLGGYTIAGLVTLLGGYAIAADYTPAWAPGGWRYDTVLHAPSTSLDGKTIQVWGQAIDANTATAEDAIPKSWRGATTTDTILGVAPLSTSGYLYNTLLQSLAYPTNAQSPALNVAVSTATINGLLYTSPLTYEPIIHMGVNSTDPNGQRWGINPESLELGGEYTKPYAGDGASSLGMTPGSTSSESINCRPYGNYDSATCLHIVNSLTGREGSRAAVGANLESSVQQLASYSAFEDVLLEINSSGAPPIMMLRSVTYDTTHVWMPGCGPADSSGTTCTPLTAEQMAHLRVGMDITTNSIPTEYVGKNILGGQTDRTVPHSYLFASFLSSWDTEGKYLTIRPGWAVMGDPDYGKVTTTNSDGTTTVTYPAQTPSITSLDTAWLPSLASKATVLIGAENKDFSEHHTLMNSFNTTGGYSLPYNQVAHAFSDGETDFENFSPVDYSDVFQGPTISYSTGNTASYAEKDVNNSCALTGKTVTRYVNMDPTTHDIINLDACGVPNGHGAEPTADSYGFFVAGGFGLGGGSLLRLTGTAEEREIDATGLQVFGSGTPSATAGDIRELGEFRGQADGNRLRLAFWTRRETAGNNGWYNASLNLGGWVDGDAQNSWAGTSLSGSAMARIAWDSGSNLGGLDFYANNGTDILELKGDGSTNALGALNVTGGGTFNQQLTAMDNFVMRGVQYFQDSTGSNAASLTVGTDGGLTLTGIATGAALINNVALSQNAKSTFTQDMDVDASLSVAGNTTLGGNGGSVTIKDSIAAQQTLSVTGQLSALGNLIVRGPVYFQDTTGANSASLTMGSDGGLTLTGIATGAALINNVALSQNAKSTFTQDITVDASETVGGNLTVGGGGGTTTLKDGVVFTSLAGTGNAYACLNASGQLYRSTTACN